MTPNLNRTDPHAYNDYEHFTFSHAQKPYLEFPIEKSGAYSGGSPGADRVVIGSIAEDYSACSLFSPLPSHFPPLHLPLLCFPIPSSWSYIFLFDDAGASAVASVNANC